MEKNEFLDNHLVHSRLIDALFDENRDLLILTTKDLDLLKLNQSASVYLGVPAESLVGHPISTLMDAENRTRLAAITAILSIDGETINTHFSLADYLGNRHQLMTGIRYIQYEEYQRSYYLFIFRRGQQAADDPSSRIDFEQLIQRLLKSLSDSVLLIDMVNRVIADCNGAAEALFGYARTELIGRSPQFLAPSEEAAKIYVIQGRTSYAKTGFYQIKMPCRRKDGTLLMTWATNIALFDGNGQQKYVLAINKDLTQDEKRLDDIVRLSEQSQRLLQSLNESIKPLKSALPVESLSERGFSRRQIEICATLITGETTKAIASKLKVSESAIKNHLSSMYRLVGASSRIEFISYLHDHRIRIE
jgi:PAS domain S-box-containing protein